MKVAILIIHEIEKILTEINKNIYPKDHIELVTQLCPTLCHPMDCSPPGSSIHGIFQAKFSSTGVACHFLPKIIFPTQGLNPDLLCLLYCRWILNPLSHQGN